MVAFVLGSSQPLGSRVSWADQHQQSGRFKAAVKGNEDGDEKRGNTTGREKGEKGRTTNVKSSEREKRFCLHAPAIPYEIDFLASQRSLAALPTLSFAPPPLHTCPAE